MYLTYNEYQEMGGTLDVTTFNLIEFEAESLVNWYTFNRLKGTAEGLYPEELTKCMYTLISLINMKMEAMALPDMTSDSSSSTSESGAITHQSNDGVSISYNVVSASQAIQVSKSECADVIKKYLQGVTNELGHKLLYRGIYPDE